jgi:hypothetical protein
MMYSTTSLSFRWTVPLTSSVHVSKLPTYDVQDPVVPEQCAVVTEKLGEYLITVGY